MFLWKRLATIETRGDLLACHDFITLVKERPDVPAQPVRCSHWPRSISRPNVMISQVQCISISHFPILSGILPLTVNERYPQHSCVGVAHNLSIIDSYHNFPAL